MPVDFRVAVEFRLVLCGQLWCAKLCIYTPKIVNYSMCTKNPLNPEVPIACEIKCSLYVLFTLNTNCLQFCNFPFAARAAVYIGGNIPSV